VQREGTRDAAERQPGGRGEYAPVDPGSCGGRGSTKNPGADWRDRGGHERAAILGGRIDGNESMGGT